MIASILKHREKRILVELYKRKFEDNNHLATPDVIARCQCDGYLTMLTTLHELERAGYIEKHLDGVTLFWNLAHPSKREDLLKQTAIRYTDIYRKELVGFLKTYDETKSNFIQKNGRLPGPFDEHQMTCKGIQSLSESLNDANVWRKQAGMSIIESMAMPLDNK